MKPNQSRPHPGTPPEGEIITSGHLHHPSGHHNEEGVVHPLAKLEAREPPSLGDEDINTNVTPTAPAAIHTGPITRARARQLNYQVLSFLGNDSNVHENMMLPKLDTFVLLTNEGPSLEKKDEPGTS